MIAYTMVGTNDFETSAAFYDTLLGALGAERAMVFDGAILWATPNGPPFFCITRPADGKPATVGNGSMIALAAQNPADVDRLHALALSLGAKNEGDPAARTRETLNYYAGYFRDPDGNKLNVFCMR